MNLISALVRGVMVPFGALIGRNLAVLTLLWVAGGIVVAWTMPSAQGLKATPAAFFHVPMAIAMELAFVIAAGFGVAWLLKARPIHDTLSVAFAEVGFAFGIVATLTGSVWAKVNWNAYWSWDPQQIGIVATLLTYAAIFSLRGAVEDEVRRRNSWAVFAILGVIAAIFWTFVFRRLMPSLHPTATLSESGDIFKWALRFNIIGMSLLMAWAALTRARLLGAQQSLERAREARELNWN
jgi:ABC-type transport system involved in cytochrome c biogenesis permease subunit